jgi:hypothetical protein
MNFIKMNKAAQKTIAYLAYTYLFLVICACSPKFDWREIHDTNGNFAILMPSKPVQFSRELGLDGQNLHLHMTAAETNGINFAVAYAKLDEEKMSLSESELQRTHMVEAMKSGMINNIHGKNLEPISIGKSKDIIQVQGIDQNGKTVILVGRFFANGNTIFQVVVLSKDKAVQPEILENFFNSFKFNPK